MSQYQVAQKEKKSNDSNKTNLRSPQHMYNLIELHILNP